MARAGFNITVGQSLGDGRYNSSSAGNDGGAALATAIATAVADGATPTQAHVTAINTANTAATAADVVVTYDATKVTGLNQLKRVLDEVLRAAQASGMV